MGNVSSRLDDGPALFLRDQTRLSIASLTITNSTGRPLLNIVPNAFPASHLTVSKGVGDESNIEFVQDPDPSSSPSFLLRLQNNDELNLNFTFIVRQTQLPQQGGGSAPSNTKIDTIINGLTFVFASNARELENLVTREFHADPNLHKNPNVQLVGDYSTSGNSSIQFVWSWRWRPPKVAEDKGGGWRNSCSFVEYDQRAHRLHSLASFSFWVENTQRALGSPTNSPRLDLLLPPKLRAPSGQSVDSRLSENDLHSDRDPPSPTDTDTGLGLTQVPTNVKDVSCQRPGDDVSAVEDGPLFRATMKSLESKTGSMRTKMKKVLKKAEAAHLAQLECNEAMKGFIDALREASGTNAHAIQPAVEHYFEKIAREILSYEKSNAASLQKLVVEPLTKVYNVDIKQAESKKKDFEDESRDFYAYVSRYLGQRQDSLKEKKRAESDSKYQSKRRNFELKRFDYSSFMQDLHGGRKEQEVLSYLTRYADSQAKSYLATAKKVEEMLPQLEALNTEVREADLSFQFQRTEREEKRRTIEMSTKLYNEPETVPPSTPAFSSNGSYITDSELGRSDSTSTAFRSNGSVSTIYPIPGASNSLAAPPSAGQMSHSMSSQSSLGVSPGQNKFRGIRDLEERDQSSLGSMDKSGGAYKKEGLLWALSRPGSHVDPKGLNKQAWHKFWIVLDQGRLSEYSNWKQRLDLHMEPIDLRMASVREARNAERRFCFEVITPHYKRVYQATSEEDMQSWISAINNALQSAFEGRGLTPSNNGSTNSSLHRDIGSILTGKNSSHSQSAPNSSSGANSVYRRITVGARPSYTRSQSGSFEEDPSKLLQIVREVDQGNCWCADCGSGIKTEWVSINLGIILCIECSGIHRSLGTHISKIRSLTLDTTSFTADIVELILQIGNRVSNMVWEARLESSSPIPKPSPNANREQRLRFITAKYVDRLYVAPLSPSQSHFSTPDETLLASIKKNDLQGVLHALALRCNTNAHDRSRNTHAVFLALAAADPAPPGSTTPPMTNSPKRPDTAAKVVAFPMAELLLQNGAEIPTTLPAFPLSPSAQVYVDQKRGRAAANAGTPATPGGDMLTALPIIKGGEGTGDRQARLQKRVSAGGRLARSPGWGDRS